MLLEHCTSTAEVTDALKSQLMFYKNVVKPPVHRSRYFVTHNGEKLGNDTFKENLFHIISSHISSISETDTKTCNTIPGPSDRHAMLLEKKKSFSL